MIRTLVVAPFALTLVACSAPVTVPAQDSIGARIARIENGLVPVVHIVGDDPVTFNLEDRLEEFGVPGMSVAFVEDGEISWSKAWGMADVASGRPMDVDTLLLAGSISKPVAAIRALQLAENGVFDLDEDVNRYLKSWQLPENEFTSKEKVTIRRILNHTAGLTVWGFPGYDKGDDVPTVIEVLDGLGNTDPVRVFQEPGKAWLYSGGGTTIMQLAITDQEGLSFPDTMQAHVLDPMRMPGSTFENPLPEEYHSIAATGYRINGDEVEGKWPIYPEMAAAGLWTKPSELIQYAIEIQRIHQTGEDGVLRHDTVVEMLSPGLESFGLGPMIDEFTFSHGGADEGFRAHLVAWKDQPYAVVAMVNSDNGRILREFLLSVAREYDLRGIEQEIREVADMQAEQMSRFEGRYEMPEYETFNVRLVGDRLEMKSGSFDPPLLVLPQSSNEFFSVTDGEIVTFDVDGDEVLGFEVWGLRAERVN